MSISSLFQTQKKENPYASSFKRSSATMIDMLITLMIRTFSMQLMAFLWLNQAIIGFSKDINEKFGTESLKNTPEHLSFFFHHSIFINILLFYFITLMVGAIYHIYFNSSKWQATIGKRILGIIMIKENNSDEKAGITVKTASLHYFLSILPFSYALYLVIYHHIHHHSSFFQTITASEINVFLGIIFVLWVQIQVFTKKKTTAYDMICKTNFINGRTSSKTPW